MIKTVKKFKYFIYILLASVWMAFIFFNSSLVGDTSSGFSEAVIKLIHKSLMWFGNSNFFVNLRNWTVSDSFHLLIRKAAHFVEFGILGILLFLSLGIFGKLKTDSKMRAVIASAISLIYAVSDEIHQLYVPGRACSVVDMAIDTAGAVTAMLCVLGILYLKDKKIEEQ